jgi:DmsE family decaheme c-type cytochrome
MGTLWNGGSMSGIAPPRQVFLLLAGIGILFFAAVCSFGREPSGQDPARPAVAESTTPSKSALPQAAATQEKTTAPATKAADAEYVGSETCKTCHEALYNGWEKSPHWKQTFKEGGIAKHGCEDCHGPGSAHVAGGGDVTKIFVFTAKDHSTKEINARCMTCHAAGAQHMNAINSIHSASDVSCISCHSPHHAKEAEFLLVKSQPELCYSCHLQQKAQFDMPFHHRVNEGLVQCTDCHNPHGTIKPKQVRTSSTQDAICFKCHTDKQGPFVYEHAPVKVDGCQSCHLTHGGPNPHMLKVSNLNLLCLQCHTTSSFSSAPGAPSFHNQASLFQSCVLCHSQIHGSNFDATFFK